MGLCEVIGCLADAVATKYDDGNGWNNLCIHVLRSAPIYRDAGRLDAWDEALRDARGDQDASSPIVELLDAISDLGSYNLYGAFDVPGTRQEYNRLVRIFQAEGVAVPADPDLSNW